MKDKPITFGSLTWTAYLFSSALFSLANTLQISPLEKKYPYIVFSRTGAEKLAPRTRRKKKIKIANIYGHVWEAGEGLRQRAPIIIY